MFTDFPFPILHLVPSFKDTLCTYDAFLGILDIMSHFDLHKSAFRDLFFFVDSIAKRIGFNN